MFLSRRWCSTSFCFLLPECLWLRLRSGTFHPPPPRLALPLVSSRLPLALLGCLVPFAAGGTAAVAASLPGALGWWTSPLCPGTPGSGAGREGREGAGVVDASASPPIFSVQMGGPREHPGVLDRDAFVELWVFTSCKLKERDKGASYTMMLMSPLINLWNLNRHLWNTHFTCWFLVFDTYIFRAYPSLCCIIDCYYSITELNSFRNILHFGFLRSLGDLIKLLKLMLLNSPFGSMTWAISGDNLTFLLNYYKQLIARKIMSRLLIKPFKFLIYSPNWPSLPHSLPLPQPWALYKKATAQPSWNTHCSHTFSFPSLSLCLISSN